MKVLIAEDDPISCRVLEASLASWGYEVVVTRNGIEALKALEAEDAPKLTILDWMMPEMDGVDVCRQVRQAATPEPPYIILLTARVRREDIVTGIEAGSNDYITKPFDREELRVRLGVGARMVELQSKLAEQVRELEQALSRVKQLQGLLPICAYCKRVRDDQDYWHQVEAYVSKRTDAQFSHGICPDCYPKVREALLKKPERET